MAAAGGDTVVPTNWKGLIMTAVAVAIVAGLTYMGLNLFLGQAEGEGTAKPETSLQDLYSVNARRDIPAMDTVRALPRTALAPTQSLPPPDIVDDEPNVEAEMAEMAEAADTPAETASDSVEEAAESRVEMAEAEPVDSAPGETTNEEDLTAQSTDDPVTAQPEQSPSTQSQSDTLDTRYRVTTAALRAWWASEDAPAEALSIRFVGPLDASVAPQGMGVLFDHPVDAQTFASFISLQSPRGQSLQPQWYNGQNPRLVYTKGLAPGRYSLSLDAGLPARNGYLLPQQFSGPVFVN